jgi:hypothetical protein
MRLRDETLAFRSESGERTFLRSQKLGAHGGTDSDGRLLAHGTQRA